jgi:hypothetical protein
LPEWARDPQFSFALGANQFLADSPVIPAEMTNNIAREQVEFVEDEHRRIVKAFASRQAMPSPVPSVYLHNESLVHEEHVSRNMENFRMLAGNLADARIARCKMMARKLRAKLAAYDAAGTGAQGSFRGDERGAVRAWGPMLSTPLQAPSACVLFFGICSRRGQRQP